MNDESAKFITLDVKYISLRASRTQMQDYSFTEVTQTNCTAKAEIYMLCFEGIANYTAIVPKHVWENATSLTHGVDPLISKVPAWCFVFMVHDDDLKTAILNLIDTVTGEAAQVTNPTVGVSLTGYRPKATQEKHFSPTLGGYDRARLSYDALTWLWDGLEKADLSLKVHFNPLAPLICDFLLEIPGIPEAVTIEAKINGSLADLENIHIETGERRSPFAWFRQWHFLIVQANADEDTFLCFGRHEVQQDWLSQRTWTYYDYRRYLIHGQHAIERLVERISQNFQQASEKLLEIAASTTENEVGLDDLITSNAADRLYDSKTSTKSASLVFHQPGLPWVADILNEQCRQAGRGICFALDAGHPVSTHVMVDWVWTSRQREEYDMEGILPTLPYAKNAMECSCVALDLIDLSGAKDAALLGMREYYWTLPTLKQQFITVGSILKASDLLPTTSFSPSVYFMFPSQHFKRMHVEPRKTVSGNGYDGKKFFQRITQGENAANPEIWKSQRTDVEPLKRGSKLLNITDHAVNPLEYLVDLHNGSLRAQIFKIFDGDGEMSIEGFQNIVPNRPISKPSYRTTLRVLHQATWDYGGKLASFTILPTSKPLTCPR